MKTKPKHRNCYLCPKFSHVSTVGDITKNIPWCTELDKETNALAPICGEESE